MVSRRSAPGAARVAQQRVQRRRRQSRITAILFSPTAKVVGLTIRREGFSSSPPPMVDILEAPSRAEN